MSKNKKEIIGILQSNNFGQNQIEEIIIKDKKQAIISVTVFDVDSNKSQITKDARNAEKEIAKILNFEKVTVILVISKSKKTPKVQKTQNPKKIKESQEPKKIKKSLNIFAKIKNILQKDTKKESKKLLENSKSKNKVHQSPKTKDETRPEPKSKPQNAQKHLNTAKKLKNVKKIIAIASAKGGVGKSTLAANIALTLSKIGHKTALVDADIYGPSIAHIMNLDDKPQNKDNLIIPHEKYGVKFISVANLINKDAAGIWRAAMINKILNQLVLQTNWGYDGNDVDIMIIDMPPGTGDIYLSLAQNFDLSGAVLVSTPQDLAKIDLIRSIDCFEKLNVKILGLIENMAYFQEKDGEKNYIFGQGNLENFAKEKNIDFLGQIEIIKELGDNEKGRPPLSFAKPNHQFSHQIGLICEKIL